MTGKITKTSPLKTLLESLDMNQTDFCKQTGIAKSLLSSILNGKRSITPDVIVKTLAKFTNVNIFFLLSGDGDMYISRNSQTVHDIDALKNKVRELKDENLKLKLENQRLKAEIYDLTKR